MAITELLLTAGLQLLFKILEKIWDAEKTDKTGDDKHGLVKDFIQSTPFGVDDVDGFITDVVALFKKHKIFVKGE